MNSLQRLNPFSGESTGSYEQQNFTQVKAIVNKLKSTQKEWAKLPLDSRLELVKNALNYFEQNRQLIAKDICEQMGRPLHHATGEISGLLERAGHMCSIAKDTLAPDKLTDKAGFQRSIHHDPLGTIFVISAWNFPLLITINSVIPALLAGNTVLLKHSSLTPEIGRHFTRAFGRLGNFDNLLADVVIDHTTTGEVIEKCDIDHVIFTGSVGGGRQILAHTAKRFMMPGLELGGKDAGYVHKDADVAHAAATIVDGAMFNAGQSCCGMERAYVHADVYDEFVKEATKLVEAYQIGDPKDPNTSLGPVANAKAADYMQKQVDDAVSAGAKVLVGGHKQIIQKGTFFEATLLINVSQKMEIMQEENFGPILPVMKVTSMEEAINYVNDSDYGLTSAIFTREVATAKAFADEVNTGTVFMNRCDYLDPALPWTGVKNSGVGSSLSKYGFYHVTRRKALHFKVKL